MGFVCGSYSLLEQLCPEATLCHFPGLGAYKSFTVLEGLWDLSATELQVPGMLL